MSVFDAAQQPQGQSQPSQEVALTPEQQESYLAKLVAAKGENWKDPEVLAKGKLEADGYIKNLEDQLKQLREDLGQQEYSKKLLDQLQNKATQPASVNTGEANSNKGGTGTEGNTKPDVSEDLLKSLVEQTLTKRDKEATVKQNLAVVDEELQKAYGTEAATVVQAKAKELGVTIQRLQELASESPTAFFNLIGEPNKPLAPIVQGTIRTEGVNMQHSAERNWDYYQNLRRKDKQLYFSPKIQRQLIEDKQRLGARFGI